jgi:hypothetical protein
MVAFYRNSCSLQPFLEARPPGRPAHRIFDNDPGMDYKLLSRAESIPEFAYGDSHG